MRPVRWPGPLVLVAALMAPLAGGCEREIIGATPPLDRLHFPTGVTLHPDGRHIAVVSSNFDLGFSRGALFMVDLDLVDERLGVPGRVVNLVDDVFNQVVVIPPFGNEPVFARGGDFLLLSARGENILLEIPLSLDEGRVDFGCRFSEELGAPLCGLAPSSLQVPGNDPFLVVVIAESEQRVIGLITTLSSPQIFYFRLNFERTDDQRLTLDNRSFSLDEEGYTLEGIPRGVRGLALRPRVGEIPSHAFVAVERTAPGRLGRAIDLVWFDAQEGRRQGLRSLDLTALTGSIEVRDVAISPGGDAVFVLLRNPDALVRVELENDEGGVSARLGGITSTCFQPVDLATARLSPAGADAFERVYVGCFDNDTVLAYETRTLFETETLRNMGRGPYSLSVDPGHEPPRLYVSFFLDDTVGVVDLTDAAGLPAMLPRAVLGTIRPSERGQR
jgi:hypothetical protein